MITLVTAGGSMPSAGLISVWDNGLTSFSNALAQHQLTYPRCKYCRQICIHDFVILHLLKVWSCSQICPLLQGVG